MLILGTVLILLYFIAQVLEVAAGAVPLATRYAPILFAISVPTLSSVAVFAAKKWPVLKNNNKTALVIGHLSLYGIIFVSYNKFETHYAYMGISLFDQNFSASFLNLAFVFAIAIASAFCIPSMIKAPFMEKYFAKKYIIGLVCISAYTAFAVIGDSLFFQHDFSFVTLMVYLLGVLWIFPMTLQILALYELIVLHLQRKDVAKAHSHRFVWLTSFGIFMGIWLIYLIAYNPAQMSSGSLGMWNQAISGDKIGYLAFSTMVIFIVRLLTYIIPHPLFIAIIQIVLLAVLSSFFMLEFYKRGISLRVIYIFAGVFAALPQNGLMLTTLWSNIPYTLSLLYLTYAIFRILSPDKGRIIPYINIVLALSLTYSMRHEGFVPAILCAAFLLFLSFRKSFDVKLMISTITGCLLIFLTQGPLYNAITIEHDKSPDGWYVMLDGLHSVSYYNGNLSEETQDFMESLMPMDIWKAEYSVYNVGTQLSNYTFSELYSENVRTRAEQKGFTSEVFRHYVDTLKREPLMLIKNRLANTNLIWDITQPKGTYNERPLLLRTLSDQIGFPHKGNFLEIIISKLFFPATVALAPLDVLCYRSGIYVILSLILCVFLISRRLFKTSIVFLPMVGGIIALLIAMSWPCFRTIWFISVIFAFIVPLSLAQAARSGNVFTKDTTSASG